LRFTKTLIGAAAAAAVLGILATAAPAMAASDTFVSFPIVSTVAPGTTGGMGFAFRNSGVDAALNSTTAAGIANPSTVTFTAPNNSTFPAQTTVPSKVSTDGGATYGVSGLQLTACVVSNAGVTLTCALTSPGTTTVGWPPNAIRMFIPQVAVSSSVAAGAVLTGGSASMNWYDISPQRLGGTPGYSTGSSAQSLLTAPPGPGQPIYNEDGSVDIPGFGTPGATITVKDASGTVIGTATVAADGTYDVKLPAAQGGTVTVTESDLPGTSWPVTIATDLLGTPIVNPLIAGGAALALAAGLGTLLVRRRKAAVEA
jgi:hypothetical protein